VRRTKEILSANTGAPFSVEELHEGLDFSSSIKREEFEEMAGGCLFPLLPLLLPLLQGFSHCWQGQGGGTPSMDSCQNR
jgi:molecular chaperone DnaK (HSP70)